MNLVQTLISLDELCNNSLISLAITAVKTVFTIIQFAVPAVLIVLCAIDMFKAMASNADDKEISKIKKKCIYRLVYALIIFLIVPILQIIMSAINGVINIKGTADAQNTFSAFFAFWNQSGGGSGSSSSSNGSCHRYSNGEEVSGITEKACKENNDIFYWVDGN